MTNEPTLLIKKLDPDLPTPRYAYPGDAGLDLIAAKTVTLQPFERYPVPCGIAVAIPEGYAGFVQPRSGLAVKHGISIVNTPGLIDSGYRGEIMCIMINLDANEPFTIERGERLAQLVILKTPNTTVECVDELPETVRGDKGFGSSGLNSQPK